MTEENLEKCIRLQELRPYGIYFSVNPMEKGKRDASSVTKIQTWICDIDTGTKEEQENLIKNAPLTPTFVVESVHGFHIYYTSKEPMTKEQYEKGNLGVMSYYHGDPKVCKDIARVLRIPGYYHCKGEKQMVKLRDDLFCGLPYTYDQMLLAFPYLEETQEIKQETKVIEKKRDGDDDYWYKVNQLDNKQMLLELSGTKRVNYEVIGFKRNSDGTEQITINGQPRSCWIDKNGMIGSYDNGGPSFHQWLTYYLKREFTKSERSEFAKRINANHPELENKPKKFEVKELPKVEKKGPQKGYLYPAEEFDEFECFLSGELVTIVAETNSGKTTFAMDMIKRNADRGRKGLYINLEFAVENVWKNKWLWFHGKTKQNISDLNPLTEIEEKEMNAYIQENMKTFDSYSNPNGIELQELEELIYNKSKEGYELFVIDSFSRIHGNLDGQNARGYQNKCMEELQELVQKLDIAIVMLHHTNKFGKFEGTQKIADLSNVFIFIQKENDDGGGECRRYLLYKDKFVTSKELKIRYTGGSYEKV